MSRLPTAFLNIQTTAISVNFLYRLGRLPTEWVTRFQVFQFFVKVDDGFQMETSECLGNDSVCTSGVDGS
jgi:hypothetical protein